MRRNYKTDTIVDRWFKVTISGRKSKSVDYSYISGVHKEVVRREVQESLGPAYIIKAEPIEYFDIIKELGNEEFC